jgi:bacterioferritin
LTAAGAPPGGPKPTRKGHAMKGNQTVIETLNDLLADELTAINQYMVHSEMCKDWGYEHLHEVIEKRAITEMRHAEKLIGRILFLEGRPMVSNLKPMHIGADVPKQLENDRHAEDTAVGSYNKGVRQAAELADNGTRDMLQDILVDEEAHLDELEGQLDQIAQMGLQNFLQAQLS